MMAAIYVAAAVRRGDTSTATRSCNPFDRPLTFPRRHRIRDPRQHVLVAARGERVIAFAVVRPSEDADTDSSRVGELDSFYSHPSVWGEGIGRELLVGGRTLRHSGFARRRFGRR